MSATAAHRRAEPLGLVGRDLAAPAPARHARAFGPVVVAAALLAGLAVAAIRNEQLRLRYELTAAMQQERDLLQQRRALTARVLALRDPDRLARLARQRGFVRPAHVRELAGDPRR
jgi:hypothetical protein